MAVAKTPLPWSKGKLTLRSRYRAGGHWTEPYLQINRIRLTRRVNKRVMGDHDALQILGWHSKLYLAGGSITRYKWGSSESSCGPTFPGPSLPRDTAGVTVTAILQAPEALFYSPAKSPQELGGVPRNVRCVVTTEPPPAALHMLCSEQGPHRICGCHSLHRHQHPALHNVSAVGWFMTKWGRILSSHFSDTHWSHTFRYPITVLAEQIFQFLSTILST